jgi:Domain of unknown function (DUF4412)
MGIRALPVMVLVLAAATPAAAQEHPLLHPTRDVMVEYHVSGVIVGQQRSDTVRMYFTDQGTKLRIEPVGQPAYSIMDRTAGRMILVMTPQHFYMEMPFDPKQVMAFERTDETFTRRGTDTVAGIGCTIYDAKRQDHSGQVCISDDGLLLRAKSNDPAQAGGGLEATRVAYGPQPASLFTPPPGFQKMEVPATAKGAPR